MLPHKFIMMVYITRDLSTEKWTTHRERFVDAPLLLGAGDWDLLLCPAEGVGRVRRDLVGVPGGEGAASLDDDVVFELVIVYIVNCTIRCERLECACTIVASSWRRCMP